MNRFTVLAALLATLVAAIPNVAHAGFLGGKKGGDEPVEVPEIVETQIAAFDDVFAKAKEIHDTLDGIEADLKGANAKIAEAGGLAEDASLADALDELWTKAEGKLDIAMDGTRPTLKASDAVPADVKRSIDAVNGAVSDITGAAKKAKGLVPQVKELIAEAKTFPGKLNSTMLSEAGLKATDLPKTARILKKNVKAVTATLTRIERIGSQVVEMLQTIANAAKSGANAVANASVDGVGADLADRGADLASDTASRAGDEALDRAEKEAGLSPKSKRGGRGSRSKVNLEAQVQRARAAFDDAEVEQARALVDAALSVASKSGASDEVMLDLHHLDALIAFHQGNDAQTDAALGRAVAVDSDGGYEDVLGPELAQRRASIADEAADAPEESRRDREEQRSRSARSPGRETPAELAASLEPDEKSSGGHKGLWLAVGGTTAAAGGALIAMGVNNNMAFNDDDYRPKSYGKCDRDIDDDEDCYDDRRDAEISADTQKIYALYAAGGVLLAAGGTLVGTQLIEFRPVIMPGGGMLQLSTTW